MAPGRMDPTWANQIEAARDLRSDELRHHAAVSRNNRHRCEDCFCCAALTVLEERDQIERGIKCPFCGCPPAAHNNQKGCTATITRPFGLGKGECMCDSGNGRNL